MAISSRPPEHEAHQCHLAESWTNHSRNVTILDMRPWTPRSYGFGVDIGMTFAVVFLDMLEVGRLLELRMVPVHAFEPVVQDRILASYHTEVTFEVLNIDRVEADQSTEYPHIDFGHLIAEDVRAFILVGNLLELVQTGEYSRKLFLISLLVWRKSGLCDQLWLVDCIQE